MLQPSIKLAPLREDLRLFSTAADADGAPSWVIQDPANNRFYKIGWMEYECLLRWPDSPEKIVVSVNQQTPLNIDTHDVVELSQFLEQHYLVRPNVEGIQRIKQQAHARTWQSWRWWLKNYLFIRLPLVRPTRFLQKMVPWVEPLFTRQALILLLLVTALGLFMVIRQWDVFTHSLVDLLNPAGLAGFVVALVASKMLHEMGHALVATRLGVRVAHMGVAFLVLWPMLYTDTGESWRLRSHRQRLAISIAGVSVELALAGLATFFWAVSPDGAFRDAMLYLATTAWILSLALNVSPFMRFDGYFILSDLLGFPNLHERSGSLARTRLRRRVLGLMDPDPEQFSPRQARFLTVFAWATWLYRLMIFLAIAWAVYTFFFKLLGIVLLIAELAWFVARPIWSELKVWKERWSEVSRRRRLVLFLLALTLLSFLALPWQTSIQAPAMVQAERQQIVYGPFPARLTTLQPAGEVAQGTLLAAFDAPDLQAEMARYEALRIGYSNRLQGLMADEPGLSGQRAIIERLQEQESEIRAHQAEMDRLRIHAQFDGVWLDIDPINRTGSWVDAQTRIGILIDPQRWFVNAYVEQKDIDRIAVGASAVFYPAGYPVGLNATVEGMDPARVQRDFPDALNAEYGGRILTHQPDHDGRFVPIESQYRVRLALSEPLALTRQTTGTIRIQGRPRSRLWWGIKSALTVLIRESGF